jgi:predicted MPP superfamily phosphohydrolase
MDMMRRGFLAAGSAGLLSVSTATAGPSSQAAKKPGVRMAHITDVHIMPEREAPAGAAAMLDHMLGNDDWRPELILNTGDSVMGVDGRADAYFTRGFQAL